MIEEENVRQQAMKANMKLLLRDIIQEMAEKWQTMLQHHPQYEEKEGLEGLD